MSMWLVHGDLHWMQWLLLLLLQRRLGGHSFSVDVRWIMFVIICNDAPYFGCRSVL